MADNFAFDLGSGATGASDEIGGVHYARVKAVWGADGVANDTEDSNGKRLPVKVGEALPAGTNNIGDVDVLSQPARVATTDNIGAKIATDAIMNGTTALTPKFAAIAAASSGSNTLVAAVTSKKIRVLALMGVVNAATNIYFDDGASNIIFGGSTNKIELVANQGFVLQFNPIGWMETASGQALRVNLSAANKFSGGVVYVEV
jgi:hypothetical protein